VDGEQEVQAKLKARSDVFYHMLPWGTSDQTAQTFFEQAHGRAPERVIQTGGGTLVGPVPAEAVRR
jgi:radical SAM superfamily enzyme YgiQ (UPF0313 family)